MTGEMGTVTTFEKNLSRLQVPNEGKYWRKRKGGWRHAHTYTCFHSREGKGVVSLLQENVCSYDLF